MDPKRLRHVLRKPEGEGGDAAGGGGAAAGAASATGGAAAGGAPGAGGAGAAGAAGGAASGAAAGAGGAAAGGASGAGSGGAAGGAGAAAGASGGAEAKGYWPENWRETMAKGDEKLLGQLQRYQSPEAVWQKARALEVKVSSGELKPVLGKDATKEQLTEWRAAHGIPETADKYDLGKDATKEQLTEWRAAHGIPETADKYDLGKDVKIEAADKPMFDVMMKAMHGENATPQHVAAVVKTWYGLKQRAIEAQAEADKAVATTSEDALRTEWGGEFRRNLNLIHGLLDGSGSTALKESLLGGRLADGTPIGSSPEAMRMLLGLALVQNPTGVVVPGGGGENGETIKTEIEKLQKIPARSKTEAQSTRERDLIGAALKAGFMNNDGTWKRV